MRIKEIIKWRRFCRILKRLNVINVNSEYCVKRVNFLFCLRFIHYKDVLFKNYDLRSSDFKKTQFCRQNLIPTFLWFPWCLCVLLMIKWSSDKVKVTVNKFGVHSPHVIRCFLLHYAVFCLANVNINTLPAYFYGIWKVSFFPRKHVLMSLGLSYPVYSQATQPWRL